MISKVLEILNTNEFTSLQDCSSKIKAWLNDAHIQESDKQEIINLIETKKISELRERFYRDLEFGTGGLRGIMGMGANRLNKYVANRAIQGLANYITKNYKNDMHRGVAIAYDSRNNSELFAKEISCVFAANKIPVYLFKTLQTTPILSYTIRKLNCLSGVCITASHNPPEYNGLKIYWDDGAQVIPPQDAGILNEVFEIKSFSEIMHLQFEKALQRNLINYINENTIDCYFNELLSLNLTDNSPKDIKIVYTPLHGTGKIPTLRALKLFGFHNVYVVPEQAEPNGNFPTVKKPNPEEREALTLAVQFATKLNAEIIFATDPDSDRLAIAVLDPKRANGCMAHQAIQNYVLLNGNQTGALLIYFILNKMKKNGTLLPQHKIIKTIVTSDMHDLICHSFDIESFNTLTGFKWIAGLVKAWESEHNDFIYLFGTEESYGFMPKNNVRDKDAIASMCQAAEMIHEYKLNQQNLCDVLFELFSQYGSWQEDLINVDLYGEEGAKRIANMMKLMREHPKMTWNGTSVNEIIDYKDENTCRKLQIPSSNVLQFILTDGSKISMRPSGTEPKLKFYLSVCTKDAETEKAYEQSLLKIKQIKQEIQQFINEIK